MKNHSLPGVLHSLAPLFSHYGYITVFIALAGIGVPVPGPAVLVAAAVYASFGKLNIVYIIIVEIVATVLSGSLGYAIGVFGGNSFVNKYGRYVFINKERIDKAQKFFSGHGGRIVTISPFIEGLRQTIGIIAGTSKMSWKTFFIFNLVGAVAWVGVWTIVGYFSGNYITPIYNIISQYIIFIPLGMIAIFIFKNLIKRFLT